MTQPWSLWLMPDARDNRKYKRIIKKHSRRIGSPSFEPHLILFGRVNVNPELLFEFFNNMANKQIRLTTKK